VLDTGMNSVSPSTMPRISALRKSVRAGFLLLVVDA
jgi:hypothetical protein